MGGCASTAEALPQSPFTQPTLAAGRVGAEPPFPGLAYRTDAKLAPPAIAGGGDSDGDSDGESLSERRKKTALPGGWQPGSSATRVPRSDLLATDSPDRASNGNGGDGDSVMQTRASRNSPQLGGGGISSLPAYAGASSVGLGSSHPLAPSSPPPAENSVRLAGGGPAAVLPKRVSNRDAAARGSPSAGGLERGPAREEKAASSIKRVAGPGNGAGDEAARSVRNGHAEVSNTSSIRSTAVQPSISRVGNYRTELTTAVAAPTSAAASASSRAAAQPLQPPTKTLAFQQPAAPSEQHAALPALQQSSASKTR